jgi:hypothetical protein
VKVGNRGVWNDDFVAPEREPYVRGCSGIFRSPVLRSIRLNALKSARTCCGLTITATVQRETTGRNNGRRFDDGCRFGR